MMTDPAPPTQTAESAHGCGRLVRAVLAALAASIALVLVGGRPASAHAVLTATVPRAEEILAAPPDVVELRFDEEIDPALGGISVVRPDGTRADRGRAAPAEDDKVLRVAVDAASTGTYTVAWRVVSADNHPLAGSFRFSVRTRTEAASDDQARSTAAARALSAGGRFGAYAATLAVVGILLARRYARAAIEDDQDRDLRVAAAVIAGAAAVAVAVATWGAIAVAAGRAPPQALSLLGEAVTSTRLGRAGLLRFVAAAVAASSLLLPRGRKATDAVALGAATVALTTPAVVGHASTAPLSGLAVAVDAAHLIAVAVLAGGLVAALVLGGAGRTLVQRYSLVAGPTAAAVLVSGAGSAWLQSRSIPALTGTGWGRIVGLKLAGFLAFVLVGFVNRRRLLPVAARFKTLLEAVKLEAAIVAAVLVATTLVTNRAPARVEYSRPVSADIPTRSGRVNLTVAPARVGTNELHLYFLDSAGLQRPVDAVEATVSKGDIPARRIRLTPISASHYSDYGLALPSAGRWVLTVTSISRGAPETVELDVSVR